MWRARLYSDFDASVATLPEACQPPVILFRSLRDKPVYVNFDQKRTVARVYATEHQIDGAVYIVIRVSDVEQFQRVFDVGLRKLAPGWRIDEDNTFTIICLSMVRESQFVGATALERVEKNAGQ